MADIKQFTQRLKFVRFKDLCSIFPMFIGFICSLPFRVIHSNIWLVCERENEARDNGYWFYKYLCENHKEAEAVYAINFKSVDFNKVSRLGKVIKFGSLKHWIYYFAAKKNISSQKEGKPNAAICYILEVYLGMRKNRAYIRHGICKDDQRWVYYDVTKMNLFVCSAKREYDFVKARFGYPEGAVQLLGLCRFDNLLSEHTVKRQIVIMPTMREWLRNISSDTEKYEGNKTISESEYFKTWNSLLNNSDLNELLEKYDTEVYFFPHSSMQKYLELFTAKSDRIHISGFKEFDVQKLLMESAMLITDYSSIYFDFAYMKKPLLYYQFDYEKYRAGQYHEGYFSYESDGFGKVIKNEKKLVDEIESCVKADFKIDNEYIERINTFFAFSDNKNCERNYQAILNM